MQTGVAICTEVCLSSIQYMQFPGSLTDVFSQTSLNAWQICLTLDVRRTLLSSSKLSVNTGSYQTYVKPGLDGFLLWHITSINSLTVSVHHNEGRLFWVPHNNQHSLLRRQNFLQQLVHRTADRVATSKSLTETFCISVLGAGTWVSLAVIVFPQWWSEMGEVWQGHCISVLPSLILNIWQWKN